MLQVVARDENGGACLLGVVGKQMFEQYLTGGVEEVEGFIENDHVGLAEEGRDDAYLHLVTSREVADEFLLSEDLAVGKTLEQGKPLVNLSLLDAGNLAEKREIFLRGEEVDEKAFVNIGADVLLPVLRLSGIDSLGRSLSSIGETVDNRTLVGFEQVEKESEERRLAGSIVAHKSQNVTVVDRKRWDVAGTSLAELFLEVLNVNHKRFFRDFDVSMFRLLDWSYTSPFP